MAPLLQQQSIALGESGESSLITSSTMKEATISKKKTPLMHQSYEERWSETSIRQVVQRWNLSTSEESQLRELQQRLADVQHWKNNPLDVVRYLRGPGKFEAVEGKVRAMIQWRLDYGADRLLEDYRPPLTLLYYVPSAVLQGYDKDGDPIYLERGGVMDGVGMQRYSHEDIVRHVVWLRELATHGEFVDEYEEKAGRIPSQVTIIYDMHGMSSRHLKPGVIPMFKEIVQMNQTRYCGLAKRIILLRAPSVFAFIWNIAKHFFPPEGRKLMVFTGPHNYQQVLDKYIDREVLPSCLCKEGKGKAHDSMPQNLEGGLIPKQNAEASIPDEPWIAQMMNTPQKYQERKKNFTKQSTSAAAAAGIPAVKVQEQPLPLVCLSEYRNVKVMNLPQHCHWQDEFEMVLVR